MELSKLINQYNNNPFTFLSLPFTFFLFLFCRGNIVMQMRENQASISCVSSICLPFIYWYDRLRFLLSLPRGLYGRMPSAYITSGYPLSKTIESRFLYLFSYSVPENICMYVSVLYAYKCICLSTYLWASSVCTVYICLCACFFSLLLHSSFSFSSFLVKDLLLCKY